ncbi:hypothetical protein D3C86_1700100 [compost metagenome]
MQLSGLVLSVRLEDAHYGSALVNALASQGAEIRRVQAHETSLSEIYVTLQRQEREVRA